MDTVPREAEDRLSVEGTVGVELRRENRRRKALKGSVCAGKEGDVGGERGVMSTDNVGVNETGEKSGAQSIRD